VGKASDPATAPKPAPETLEAYLGIYEMHEDSQVSEARITRTGGDLFLETQGTGRRLLTPLAVDAFASFPDGRLEFVKDANGQVTGFTVQTPTSGISASRKK
jgi:hypothetical protein